MSASVIIGIVAITAFSIVLVAFAVTCLKVLSNVMLVTDRREERAASALQSALDRLMTVKWEDYAALKSTDDPEVGGFFPPEPVAGTQTEQFRPRLFSPEEQALLDEDFPEQARG